MKLLLDTHIFLWWCLGHPDLPEKYLNLLNQAEQTEQKVYLSVISLWEVAKLVSLNKLKINFALDPWFQELEEDPQLEILPLSGRIILESLRLGPVFPKDPADQLIASSARCYELHLLTVDERIIDSKTVAIAN
jgi:PIN domain nuclease of toxin-antitoxin system